MKFQNISIHGSKVMLYTRKHDERMNERTNGQARSNMPPPTFFKVGGIINFRLIIFALFKTLAPNFLGSRA